MIIVLLTVDVSDEEKNIEDYNQIVKDVRRTLWNWCLSTDDRQHKQAALCRILVKAFAQNRGNKHYFQGCNEVASILMFALGEVQAVQALDWLMNHTLTRWFELSLPPLVELMAHVMPLLHIVDEETYKHINECIMNYGQQPGFALSWLMTWFSHNSEDVQALYKIFDVLFDTHDGDAVAIIYIATQTIVMCKTDVLKLSDDSVHEYFTKLLPPIVTRERAKKMLQAASGEAEPNEYIQPVAKGNVKVLIVEDMIEGAKKLMKDTDWDELKRHKDELNKEDEEAASHRVYRATSKHVDQSQLDASKEDKIVSNQQCIDHKMAVVVGGILFASVAVCAWFTSVSQ